jgi:hypothetical protein
MYFQWEEEEHRCSQISCYKIVHTGPKCFLGFFLKFFTQSIDDSGSFIKPVANKIHQILHAQLPTLSRPRPRE